MAEPAFIDEDHDGIDDRIEGLLSIGDRLINWAKFKVVPPIAPAPINPKFSDELTGLELVDACQLVRDGSSKTAPPPDPMIKLADGYEYRLRRAHDWCAAAGFDDDLGALSTVLAAESPDLSKFPQYGLAIADAVLNQIAALPAKADGSRTSLLEFVTRDRTHPAADGHFGRQKGRWCATSLRPNGRHVAAARAALQTRKAGKALVSLTARRWIDAKVQDGGAAKDELRARKERAVEAAQAAHEGRAPRPTKPRTKLFAHEVIRKWAREGWRGLYKVVNTAGDRILDPYVLLLFEQTGAPVDPTQALTSLDDGRRRWRFTLP